MQINRKSGDYNKDLLVVKSKLYGMMAIEEYFFHNADFEDMDDVEVVGWMGEEKKAGIQIVGYVPEEDSFFVRICALPVESDGKSFDSEHIHYFYSIENQKIERGILFSLRLPMLVSRGDAVLQELKEFLFDRLDVVVNKNK